MLTEKEWDNISWSKKTPISIDSLKGEVLAHIDTFDDVILLTTISGREIRIYHRQDCCESVSIVGTEGQLKDLVGKVIVDAKHEEQQVSGDYDSVTFSELTFRTSDTTVISRWRGESNGYYSESVDLEEVKFA